MKKESRCYQWALITLLGLSVFGVQAQTASNPVIRAQLSAARHATLSSEMSGQLIKLPFLEGQHFKKGDTLASFNCSLNQARLRRSTEAASAAKQELDVANRLDKLQSISLADLAKAKSALAVGQADRGVDMAMIQRCAISAPFSGRIGSVYVKQSEYVQEGKELFSIYDDSSFEVEMIVPSRWLAWLKPHYPFKVLLDETGKHHQGEIIRIAGEVDPVSQSVKITGRLNQDEQGLLPGMSGTVTIVPPVSEKPAALPEKKVR